MSTNGSFHFFLNSTTKSMQKGLKWFLFWLLTYTEQSGFNSKGNLLSSTDFDELDVLVMTKVLRCGEMIWFWKDLRAGAMGNMSQNSQILNTILFLVHVMFELQN